MANLEPGHRLNHTGSCTPQIMEDFDGKFQYGALIRLSDGGVTAFKYLRPPVYIDETDPSEVEVEAYLARRVAHVDVEVTMDLWDLPGNPLALPINTWDGLPDGIDDHFAVAVGVDYLERVWISGNARENFLDDHHSGPLFWTRFDPALSDGAFDNPACWTSPAYPAVFAACGPNRGHTYHHYRRLSDGTLLFFLSQHDEVGNSLGRDFLAFYLNSTTAGTWQPLITTRLPIGADRKQSGADAPSPVGGGHFCQSSGQANANVNNDVQLYTNPANRSYINAIHVEKISETIDRLHVLGIWRTADSDGRSSHSPWYLYCDNPIGNSLGWKTITGETQPMPIAHTIGLDNRVPSATVIGPTQIMRSVGNGIAIDDDHYPHFIMENGASWAPIWKPDATIPGYADSIRVSGDGVTQQSIMHVWWDGEEWQKEGLPEETRRATGGPVCVFTQGVGFVIVAHGGNECRLHPDWGRNPVGEHVNFGSIWFGGEANPDPVALTQRGEIALMLPTDNDIPLIRYFGDTNRVVLNLAFHGIDPTP